MATQDVNSLCLILAFAFCISVATAQNTKSDSAKLSFVQPKIAEPADPDPTAQTEEQRLETLRKRTGEAIALLEEKDLHNFFSDYVDPSWLARGAAGGKVSVDELFAKRIVGVPRRTAEMIEHFKTSLEASLELKPQFLLNGRATSFMEGHSSHTAEFWIYVDGKWRISPET